MSTQTALPDYTQAPNNKKLGHIPGEKGWPVVGCLPRLRTDPFGLAKHHWDKYLSLIHISEPTRPY